MSLLKLRKKTEEELRKLIGEHKKTREQLGGLAHTVGYILEDRAYKGLPELLKRDFAVEAIDFIKRDFIEIEPNRYEEINIYGKGRIDGREIWILGECKTQLKKTDIDSFLNKIKRIEKILKGEKNICDSNLSGITACEKVCTGKRRKALLLLRDASLVMIG